LDENIQNHGEITLEKASKLPTSFSKAMVRGKKSLPWSQAVEPLFCTFPFTVLGVGSHLKCSHGFQNVESQVIATSPSRALGGPGCKIPPVRGESALTFPLGEILAASRKHLLLLSSPAWPGACIAPSRIKSLP
jgi:hypothetical protein